MRVIRILWLVSAGILAAACGGDPAPAEPASTETAGASVVAEEAAQAAEDPVPPPAQTPPPATPADTGLPEDPGEQVIEGGQGTNDGNVET